MTHSDLITEEQLKEWFDCKQSSKVVECLNQAGIRYIRGRNDKICVYSGWLNQSVIAHEPENQQADF